VATTPKNTDSDWLQRAQHVYDQLPVGDREKIADAVGMPNTNLSRLIRTGVGNAEKVFAVSRVLGIAPPRALLRQRHL